MWTRGERRQNALDWCHFLDSSNRLMALINVDQGHQIGVVLA
jgi:hypothetical protein